MIHAELSPDYALAKKIASFLNEIMKIDSAAMHAMFVRKVSCNAALADHPTVQVGDDPLNVGLTGLLNGICGVNADGCGPLVSIWSSDNRLLGFTVPERSKYPEVGG